MASRASLAGNSSPKDQGTFLQFTGRLSWRRIEVAFSLLLE